MKRSSRTSAHVSKEEEARASKTGNDMRKKRSDVSRGREKGGESVSTSKERGSAVVAFSSTLNMTQKLKTLRMFGNRLYEAGGRKGGGRQQYVSQNTGTGGRSGSKGRNKADGAAALGSSRLFLSKILVKKAL